MKRLLFLIGCAVLLVAALAAPAAAQASAPLKGVVDIAVAPEFNPMGSDWFGTISGDINGYIGVTEQQGGALTTFPGKTEHFFEDWTIWVGGDENMAISGVDVGVWNFSTFKFRANGWVTSAAGDWAYLVGHKLFEIGATSDPNLWPITGHADLFIAGP